MLSNWTKATTTTTGTGTITLTAVTGFPLPSASLPNTAFVFYSIVTSDGDFESGIGTLGASETLARTRVMATYNGTTYNNTTATALTLASGTHEVFIDRVAEAGPVGCAFPFSPPTNRSHTAANMSFTHANVTVGTASRANAWSFLLPVGGILTAFAGNCSVLGSSSAIHVGLYEIGSDGWPARRIARTNSTIDTSTTGWKSGAVISNVYVHPGWYWLAVCTTTGSAPQFTGGLMIGSAAGWNGTQGQIGYIRSDTSATDLADPFLTTSKVYDGGNGTSIPGIGLVLS